MRERGSEGIILHVVETEYEHDTSSVLKFNDGAEGFVDLEDELYGEMFAPLKDRSKFSAFKLDAGLGTSSGKTPLTLRQSSCATVCSLRPTARTPSSRATSPDPAPDRARLPGVRRQRNPARVPRDRITTEIPRGRLASVGCGP